MQHCFSCQSPNYHAENQVVPPTPQRRRSEQAPELANTPTRLRRAASRAHPTHFCHKLTAVNPDGIATGVLVFCTLCGCYAQTKLGAFARTCMSIQGELPRGRKQ
eukprot:5285861-Amphidinium_carterae.1